MIQLRSVRTWSPKGQGEQKVDKPLVDNIVTDSIATLFKNYETFLERIPESERWNIYYTLGETNADTKRDWHAQEVLPFDIDDIVDADGNFDERLYLDTLFGVLGVDREKCAVVASGNGLQILIQLETKIESKDYFRRNSKTYKALCDSLQKALDALGLKGTVDASSFAHNRIMRMPGTENRKAGRESRRARLIYGRDLSPQPFYMAPTAADLPDPKATKAKDALTEKQLSFFAIDTPAVVADDGCQFIKWARENPGDLQEPQWYAMLSVVGRLADGRQLAHSYSSAHAGYSEVETDRKLDQALEASGPRTCDNIDHLWGQCQTCPHFKKVPSPVSIKSESFIATDKSGFYLLTKSGGLSPQFEDLRRYFQREHPYRTHAKSGAVYVFNEKKYGSWSQTELRNYSHEKFNPKPADHHTQEFCSWVNRTNLIESNWFVDSTRGRINFANGVYDLTDGGLSPHAAHLGFLYVLPYDYAPAAVCPTFDQFMRNITCGDEQLEKLLLEFVGYALCDRDYWLQKAILLIGEGSNGKSTFLNVVKALAGWENVSFLSLHEIQSETSRLHLEGKLINVSDELPNYNFKNTELLKKLLGGTMTMRKLYHDSVMVENTTKFIFAGNGMPSTDDVSDGLFRRLVIVPFKAKFKLEPTSDGTVQPADTKLFSRMTAELPGIFNRVMRHYQELKARGYLIESVQAAKELATYKEETDRIGSWATEHLYWNGAWDDTVPYVEVNTVFERYVSDAKRSEERPISKFHFTKRLKRQIDHWDERYSRKRIGQEKPYILRGVEFRKETSKDHF